MEKKKYCHQAEYMKTLSTFSFIILELCAHPFKTKAYLKSKT
jgi:hypothetical protein